MELNINKFCRSLTATEKREYEEFCRCENLIFSSPMLWYKQCGKSIKFYILSKNSLFKTESSLHVTIKQCVAVAVFINTNNEKLFFFEIDKASEALQFYNQMLMALKNIN